MFLIIPFLGLIPVVASVIVPVAGVVGGLIIAPAVLKASKNAVALVKDGKVGLEAQGISKRISEYEEKIADIIIEKNLEFDSELIKTEISRIKENMKKLEELEKQKNE